MIAAASAPRALLVSWLAVLRLPRIPLCAAFLVLCSCGALVPADPTQSDDEESDSSPTAGETADTTPTSSSSDSGPPPDPADIVVATFNVLRFFDTTCDSNQCGNDDYEEVPTQGQFDYRADSLTEAILGLDADIVILQEVETQDCIDALSARLGDQYPTAIHGETKLALAGSVDVAILSRHPSTEIRRHADVPLQRPSGGKTWFSREFLEVHLDADGHQVIVFAAHFKAKSDDDPERRLAEATRAREIMDAVAEQNADAMVVLGGDLNDTPGSPPLDALEAGGGMVRVAAELAPEDWTYRYMDDLRPLDHIYQATAATGAVYIAGSARVFRGDNGTSGYGGSDHAAVRASFHAE